jgi:hypothetical protein
MALRDDVLLKKIQLMSRIDVLCGLTHILIGSKELASGKRFATLMEAAGEPKS